MKARGIFLITLTMGASIVAVPFIWKAQHSPSGARHGAALPEVPSDKPAAGTDPKIRPGGDLSETDKPQEKIYRIHPELRLAYRTIPDGENRIFLLKKYVQKYPPDSTNIPEDIAKMLVGIGSWDQERIHPWLRDRKKAVEDLVEAMQAPALSGRSSDGKILARPGGMESLEWLLMAKAISDFDDSNDDEGLKALVSLRNLHECLTLREDFDWQDYLDSKSGEACIRRVIEARANGNRPIEKPLLIELRSLANPQLPGARQDLVSMTRLYLRKTIDDYPEGAQTGKDRFASEVVDITAKLIRKLQDPDVPMARGEDELMNGDGSSMSPAAQDFLASLKAFLLQYRDESTPPLEKDRSLERCDRHRPGPALRTRSRHRPALCFGFHFGLSDH